MPSNTSIENRYPSCLKLFGKLIQAYECMCKSIAVSNKNWTKEIAHQTGKIVKQGSQGYKRQSSIEKYFHLFKLATLQIHERVLDGI